MVATKYTAFDFETELFAPGYMAPKPICASFCTSPENKFLFHCQYDPVEDILKEMLEGDSVIVGHNVAFDMAVAWEHYPKLRDLIVKAYLDNRITDTMLRMRLLDYARDTFRKKYGLGDLAKTFFDMTMQKGADSWRMRYAELWDVPLKDWEPDAYNYAIDDAFYTYRLAARQYFIAQSIKYDMPTEYFESKSAFGLQQISVRGLSVDQERAQAFTDYCDEGIEKMRYSLFSAGVRVMRLKGDTKQWEIDKTKGVPEAMFANVPQTSVKRSNKKMREDVEAILGSSAERSEKTNAIKVDKKAIMAASRDYLNWGQHHDGSVCPGKGCTDSSHWMDAHLTFENLKKFKKTYMELLLDAAKVGSPVHPGFGSMNAKTSRTSSFKPNIQNQPRKPGIRECFKARDGFVLITCDYDAQEMRMFAQECVNKGFTSTLAKRFNEDKHFDPHTYFAGVVLGKDYVEAMALKRAGDPELLAWRQRAKVANFGFLGGMGANKFRIYAHGFGLSLSMQEAMQLKQHFFTVWKETRPYFNYVSESMSCFDIDHKKYGYYVSPLGFRRACEYYTQFANTGFQSLAAHATKAAVWDVWLDMQNPESDLFGSHMVAMIHDEIIIEAPEDKIHVAAQRLEQLMVAAQERIAPDVPAACESGAMTHWCKAPGKVTMPDGTMGVYQTPWTCYNSSDPCGDCPACERANK